jgi:Glycosyltransferases involved in cell wall biogenesis
MTQSASGARRLSKNAPPYVTAVVPAYNYGRFIGQTIRSILDQDFEDFELIIVNDASTDDTESVVRTFLGDDRVKYVVNDRNSGANFSLERGFALAKSPYVAAIAADDYYVPGAFRTLSEATRANPDSSFVYGKYYLVNAQGQITNVLKHPGWDPVVRQNRSSDLADLLRYDCYIGFTAAFIKRDLFETYTHDTSLRVADYDLLLRMAADGVRFSFVDEYIAAVRWHGEQISVGSNFIGEGVQLRDQLTVIDRYVIPKNFPKLKGYAEDIVRLLLSRVRALQQYPDKAPAVLATYQEHIEKTIERVRKDLLASSMTIETFMETVTRLAEHNEIPQALAFYDSNRANFPSFPELLKFDSIVQQLRSKTAGAALK